MNPRVLMNPRVSMNPGVRMNSGVRMKPLIFMWVAGRLLKVLHNA